MRVTAFRVQNYKKIRDTGWINAHEVSGSDLKIEIRCHP